MFHRQKSKFPLVTAVIYTLLAAIFPPKVGGEIDLRCFASAVAMAMLGARNLRQFDQIYDQIDITILHLEGTRAFKKHVRQLIRAAKKQRS